MWVPDPYPVYHDGHDSPRTPRVPRIPRQRHGSTSGSAYGPDPDAVPVPPPPPVRRAPHSLLPFLVRDLREPADPAYRPTRLSALCPLCALGVHGR